MKRFLMLLVAVAMVCASVPALAQEKLPPDPNRLGDFGSEYQGERILVDIFFVRPLGLLAIGVGAAGTIVGMPWAATSCSTERLGHELLEKPMSFTFERPVGDIDF